jgi:hypothetical protein
MNNQKTTSGAVGSAKSASDLSLHNEQMIKGATMFTDQSAVIYSAVNVWFSSDLFHEGLKHLAVEYFLGMNFHKLMLRTSRELCI